VGFFEKKQVFFWLGSITSPSLKIIMDIELIF